VNYVFKDPTAEDRLCKNLKTMVEEFGMENVRIHVPIAWSNTCNTAGKVTTKEDGTYLLGRCDLYFSTEYEVRIEALLNGKLVWWDKEEILK
jgi:hypothetical protein